MRKSYFSLFIILHVACSSFAGADLNETISHSKALRDNVEEEKTKQGSLNANGLCFTPNKGQIIDTKQNLCPDILYKGDDGGADIYLRKTGISYIQSNISDVMHKVGEEVEQLIKAGTITEADENQKKDEFLQKESIKVHRVDMDFEGCNSNTKKVNEDELDGYNNYYYAHCKQGITNIKQYNKITYKNIYNNIDVVYYGDKQNGIKYDLIVKPHADPNKIKLHWKGAESIHINSEGHLVIKASVNDGSTGLTKQFTESIPRVYQNIDGKIVNIKAEYVLEEKDTKYKVQSTKQESPNTSYLLPGTSYFVTFKLGTWNPELPLVIDPWATYYGGNKADYGQSIATDKSGNVLLVGHSASLNLPVLGASQVANAGGDYDAFVVKFNFTGTRQWATFYGGCCVEWSKDIATDNAGNVVITGSTNSSNFPVLSAGGYSQSLGLGSSGQDAFAVKFDSGGILKWATLYGGNANDSGFAIATDNSNNVIFTGYTLSTNFPLLSVGAAYSQPCGLTVPFVNTADAFVVKFNSSGARLWSSYYGGEDTEIGNGIAIDITDNILITGSTLSANFPVLNPGLVYSQTFTGTSEVFIVKFNSSGTRIWATFYGGTVNDSGSDIATDNSGNVIIVGYTVGGGALPLKLLAGTYTQAAFGQNNIIMKLATSGQLLWATIFGNNDERYQKVAVDANNDIYLYTEAAEGGDIADACAYQPIRAGSEDQEIIKFSSSVGKKLCLTLIGGTLEDDLDYGGGIAIFGNSIFITATTEGGYPVSAGAFQTTFAGPFNSISHFTNPGADAFVTSLCTNICENTVIGLAFTKSINNVCPNTPITFTPTIANSCDTTGYKFLWVFTGGNPATSVSAKPIVTYSGAGTYDVSVIVTTPCKTETLTKTEFITIKSCGCTLSAQTTINTNVSCSSGSNGRATVSVINGTGGPYTYSWSNGSNSVTADTNSTVTNLSSGTYTVTISEGACTVTSTATIISPPPLKAQFTKGTAGCTNCGCKEWVIVNAIGGTSPYSYTWPDGYAGRYKNKLCPAVYAITIKDKNGCNINVSLSAP